MLTGHGCFGAITEGATTIVITHWRTRVFPIDTSVLTETLGAVSFKAMVESDSGWNSIVEEIK